MAAAPAKIHASEAGRSVTSLTMNELPRFGKGTRQEPYEAQRRRQSTERVDGWKHDHPFLPNSREGIPERTARQGALRVGRNGRYDDDQCLGHLCQCFERDGCGGSIAGRPEPGIPEADTLKHVAEHAVRAEDAEVTGIAQIDEENGTVRQGSEAL